MLGAFRRLSFSTSKANGIGSGGFKLAYQQLSPKDLKFSQPNGFEANVIAAEGFA
jgi:hypothetical protein